jgi:hypothetical protein
MWLMQRMQEDPTEDSNHTVQLQTLTGVQSEIDTTAAKQAPAADLIWQRTCAERTLLVATTTLQAWACWLLTQL